jgi:cell division protein ZapD
MLLRLEFLFRQLDYHLQGESYWDTRAAVSTLLDIQAFAVARTDLQSDLAMEVDRQIKGLRGLRESPGVDGERLNEVLADLEGISSGLKSDNRNISVQMKKNSFLNTIRNRSTIPGASCSFDLPFFHQWLQSPREQRVEDMNSWVESFEPIHVAADRVLELVRSSNHPRKVTVEKGLLEQDLPSDRPCQMIRIALPPECSCYPEISSGKHRFLMRLLQRPSLEESPTHVQEDVELELTLCVI